jgi:hypothetical protein
VQLQVTESTIGTASFTMVPALRTWAGTIERVLRSEGKTSVDVTMLLRGLAPFADGATPALLDATGLSFDTHALGQTMAGWMVDSARKEVAAEDAAAGTGSQGWADAPPAARDRVVDMFQLDAITGRLDAVLRARLPAPVDAELHAELHGQKLVGGGSVAKETDQSRSKVTDRVSATGASTNLNIDDKNKITIRSFTIDSVTFDRTVVEKKPGER